MANTPRRQRPGAGPLTLDLLINSSQRSVLLSVQGAVNTIHLARHAAAKSRNPAERDDFASRADGLETGVEALLGALGTLGGTLGDSAP